MFAQAVCPAAVPIPSWISLSVTVAVSSATAAFGGSSKDATCIRFIPAATSSTESLTGMALVDRIESAQPLRQFLP